MKIASVGGVDIVLRPAVFLSFAIAWLFGAADELLLGYAALALHECAHALCARAVGLAVDRLEIAPYGGMAAIDPVFELTPGREALVAAAGPAASLIAALLCMGVGTLGVAGAGGMAAFARANAVIAIFNLLPLFPLDGGRMLRCALSGGMGHIAATRLAAGAGAVGGALLTLWGGWALWSAGNPAPLCAGLALASGGARGFMGAGDALARAVGGGQRVGRVPVRARLCAVDAGAAAPAVLARLAGEGYSEIIVLENGGEIGRISGAALRRAVLAGARTMREAALGGA